MFSGPKIAVYPIGDHIDLSHAQSERDEMFRVVGKLALSVHKQKKGEAIAFALGDVDLKLLTASQPPPTFFAALDKFSDLELFNKDIIKFLSKPHLDIDNSISKFLGNDRYQNIHAEAVFNIYQIKQYLECYLPSNVKPTELDIVFKDIRINKNLLVKQVPHIRLTDAEIKKIRSYLYETDLQGIKPLKHALAQDFSLKLEEHGFSGQPVTIRIPEFLSGLYEKDSADPSERAAQEYVEWITRAVVNSPDVYFKKSGRFFKKRTIHRDILSLKISPQQITSAQGNKHWEFTIPAGDLPYVKDAFGLLVKCEDGNIISNCKYMRCGNSR